VIKHKKTLYELLEVSPIASDAEIHSAYQKLSRQFESGAHGLGHEEADFQLKLINQAFWTLSDNTRRASYDASLVSRAAPVHVEVEIREPDWTPPKVLHIVNGSLKAVVLVILIGLMLMVYRNSSRISNEQSMAEKVSAQERSQENGGRSESEIAADKLAAEQHRQEYEKREKERKADRELEESRRYAAKVSDDLHRGEENARREAEREQQRLEQEQRRKQQEENYRIENEKRKWRQGYRHETD